MERGSARRMAVSLALAMADALTFAVNAAMAKLYGPLGRARLNHSGNCEAR